MAFGIGELTYISGLPVSLPLRDGLVSTPQGWNAVSGRPGDLDAAMAEGALAGGPISSLEFLQHRERYVLVPDLALSSWGRIGSATLFSRVPFSALGGKTIALPRAGATSNVLTQMLLKEIFGIEALYEELDGTPEALLESHTAALVIGDEAILWNRKPLDLNRLDLGEAWWQMMQTPMVYTLWAVQRSLPEDERQALITLFQQAKEAGKAAHARVVAEAAERLSLPTPEIEAYYALLNYDFAPVHRAGLSAFDEFLSELTPAG
ncbi:MAG TPA: menaquinone biosynthesis protein [Oscillatoriaceae cyanobacterium]